MSMKKKHHKISEMQKDQALKYKVIDLKQKYPLNCICYIKIKIYCDDKKSISEDGSEIIEQGGKVRNVKGSGILISKDLVLTAAHNVYDYEKNQQLFENMKNINNKKSYVKIALCEGSPNGVFDIQWIKVSQKYITYRANLNNPNIKKKDKKQQCFDDYAIIKIRPREFQKFQEIQRFPIPIAIDNIDILSKLSICGYPVQPNRQNNQHLQDHSNSSIFMTDTYGAQGDPIRNPQSEEEKVSKKKSKKFIEYDIPTDVGTSGSGILTKFKQNDVIIGIHKAARNKDNAQSAVNVGIKLTTAIEEVNKWGYQCFRKPLIFTQKTMKLHEDHSKIHKSQILFFLDKKLQINDMYVITSYDLSNLRKIMLSGSRIRDEGFKLLTNRKFNQLQTLFVSQNHLRKLKNIPIQNWQNISTVKSLALNINKIIQFPEHLKHLTRLQHLWLSYNRIDTVTQSFITFCLERTSKLIIHMYENNFKQDKPDIIEAKKIISESKVECLWKKVKKEQ